MTFLRFIPMFAVVLAAYFVVVVGGDVTSLASRVTGATLTSGGEWTLSAGDLLLVGGVLALYIELFKATRTGSVTVIDHSLSMLVFVGYVILFITVKDAGTSVFLVLGLMSLVDVVAGFTITIAASRRDVSLGGGLG